MNTKLILFLAVAVVSAQAALAEHTPVHPSRMEEFNKKTGGLVMPPANAAKLVYLDARGDRSVAFTNNMKAASRLIDFGYVVKNIQLKEGACPLEIARGERKNGAGAVIVFLENDKLPVLSVYPEEAITVLNVKPLRDNDENAYRRRVNKEFWRCVSFTLGGYGGATQGATVLAPVYSLKHLDDLRTLSLTPSQVNAIIVGKTRLGLFGGSPAPYSRACREGWAPAPTNEYQQAIWDKIKNSAADAKDPTNRWKRDFQDKERPKAK